MREGRRLLAAIECAGDGPLVLATVLRTRGPAYRRAGAMALLGADGTVLAGGVSAGCLESDVQLRTARVLANAAPDRVVYDADGGAFAIPSGCGGTVEVLLEPLIEASHRDSITGWLRALASLGARGTAGLILRGRDDGLGGLARVIATPEGDWWFNLAGSDGIPATIRASVRRDAARAAALRSAGVFSYATLDVAWHPVEPVPTLVIGGAMPDAAPLARLAVDLDWRVRVVEHRLGRLEQFTVAHVEHAVVEPQALAEQLGGDAFGAALVMYHAETADREALQGLVTQPCGFVGVLGPRARTARLLADTPLADGVWPAWLHAPVGLDLGADTPEEIAISIMGELLSWQRGTTGAALTGRAGPLHAVPEAHVLEGVPAPWPSSES